jgi:lycopene beta-cyclase
MVKHTYFKDWTILILDKEKKVGNDRTWCFWEDHSGLDAGVAPIRSHEWKKLSFRSHQTGNIDLELGNYGYTMLRSSAFYAYAHQILAGCPNVQIVQATIEKIDEENRIVTTDNGSFEADWILNSAVATQPLVPKINADEVGTWKMTFTEGDINKKLAGTSYLMQHFKGWFIQTELPIFDPSRATLMDFTVDQANDTRFFYVLPFSETEALVEYTLFSEQLLPKQAYQLALEAYIKDHLGIDQYRVIEQEFGVIPMSDFVANNTQGNSRLLQIGTLGGTVKASSGYGFKSTRLRTAAWVADWAKTGVPHMDLLRSRKRHFIFDRVLLGVLEKKYSGGGAVFSDLFRSMPAYSVFRFLDERSSLAEDFRVMLSVQPLPFIKAVGVKLWKNINLGL